MINEASNIPSWSATNSARIVNNVNKTSVGFTLLLPYPATEYDTIYTCMKNFQDVLHQTFNQCGALWCDEGVYRLAKELQLLFPETFDDIFLGLGGFHMEKTIIACIGKYLQVVELTVYLPITEYLVPVLLLMYSMVVIILEGLEDCR